MILGELGVDLGPLVASAGVIGFAVGLGAQSIVRDVFSGIIMLLEDQYGVGDSVEVLEVKGKVESVGLRVTTIRDRKGTLWYLRNGEILKVGNSSQRSRS
jgi:small-conductance mechanosensitive channel